MDSSGETTGTALVSGEYRDDSATATPAAERGRLEISTQPESPPRSAATRSDDFGEPMHFFTIKDLQENVPKPLGMRRGYWTQYAAKRTFLNGRRFGCVLTGSAGTPVNAAELHDYLYRAELTERDVDHHDVFRELLKTAPKPDREKALLRSS